SDFGLNPYLFSILSKKAWGAASQIPTVLSPCTLECPRTGHVPAPSFPILPFNNNKFTNSLILSTAFWCCVSPMAQQMIILLLLKINSRSEEHTSELQSRENLVCRLLLEKKKKKIIRNNKQ